MSIKHIPSNKFDFIASAYHPFVHDHGLSISHALLIINAPLLKNKAKIILALFQTTSNKKDAVCSEPSYLDIVNR